MSKYLFIKKNKMIKCIHLYYHDYNSKIININILPILSLQFFFYIQKIGKEKNEL